ncbi:hypothetical protein [Stenotrophomonas sp. NPDC078853]|uniref:hypothetical protein n=1 Tax=Stenotrophomonas sp. NPDC078853 TaxID=3364534 RepID=UPI0038507BEA
MAALNIYGRHSVTVEAMPRSKAVVVRFGGGSLQLTKEESARLSLDLQRANDQLGMADATAAQYTNALNQKAVA